jgi:predicted dehydrogenase
MKQLNAAVIGTGHLGYYHAQKYANHPDVNLAAIVDIDSSRAGNVADELGTLAYTDYKEILDQVDLVSIAVTTKYHFDIARDCLKAGIHVLVEKPITQTVAEAQELIDLAKEHNVKLQVGHSERFHPALKDFDEDLKNIMFIESHRLAPFKIRGTDVDVVMDLMIHDIDIILMLVKSPLISVQPVGVSVVTDQVDIANARLEFENGCVANVTSSRVSDKAMRKMRLFSRHHYISIDFSEGKITSKKRNHEASLEDGHLLIDTNEKVYQATDVILDEINCFIIAIRKDEQPVVTGEDGLRALKVALEVTENLNLVTGSNE